MANPEHVAKLQEGVGAWNAWYKQNRDIWPDLQGVNFYEADLRRADLYRTDLHEANLVGANLDRANLLGADLRRADLHRANLLGANLRRADLHEADLHEANLRGASLAEANLHGANLRGANLRRAKLARADLREADLVFARLIRTDLNETDLNGANLNGAHFDETIFANIDLTDVKGLDSCRHKGPSIIDHRTFERSGQLPLSFLRGCGLPDTFIDYLPSLLNRPIQHYSCFISYSSKDEAFAKRLHADLQDRGVRCWFAPEDMKIGDKWRVRIDETIRTYEKLLLLLSKHSMASTWVEKEVETAFDRESECGELMLFPIRLDDAVMDSKTGWAADIRRSRNIGNFCNWKSHDEYQKGLERLLRDLQIEKGK